MKLSPHFTSISQLFLAKLLEKFITQTINLTFCYDISSDIVVVIFKKTVFIDVYFYTIPERMCMEQNC